MIFFTRELFKGIQPPGYRSEQEWKRRAKIKSAHDEVIRQLLPKSAQKLSATSFHDGEVEAVKQRGTGMTMTVDMRPALGRRGRLMRIILTGVRHPVLTSGLHGQWWLYHEVHLCSRSRFSLHILFTSSELEIEADDILVEKL
jgi:hypothetical protein